MANPLSPVSPLSLRHPVLSPGVVLVLKILALCWVSTGHLTIYPMVRHPPFFFLQPLEGMVAWPVFLTFLAVLGGLLIWVTSSLRLGALLLGGSILLALGSDPATYSNNRLFTGLMVFLMGLITDRKNENWLTLQCAVVFGGAAWDKTVNADWISGQFMQTFLEGLASYGLLWSPGGYTGGAHPIAEMLTKFGGRGFFVFASWAVILLEWVLVWGYAMKRSWSVHLSTGFFVSLIIVTGSPMGMFAFAGCACSLLLVEGIGERERMGDSVLYWGFWFLLLTSPLFSTGVVVLSVAVIYFTFRRAWPRSLK